MLALRVFLTGIAAIAFAVTGAGVSVGKEVEDANRATLAELGIEDAEIMLNGEFTISTFLETVSQVGAFRFEVSEDVATAEFALDRWRTTVIEALVWLAREQKVHYAVKGNALHVSPA